MAPKAAATKGTIIPYEGLPPGWEAIEKPYLSGIYAGTTYIRFQTKDLRHKSVGSLKKAIQIDAEERGLDPAQAKAEYEQRKEEEKERQKQERESKGLLDGQRKNEAIEFFRSAHGKLDGATICQLPGWRGESKLLEKCGQLSARYYSPEGVTYALVNQVEAFFGFKMQKGEPVPDFEAARNSVQVDEKGKVINSARTEHIVDSLLGESAPKRQKRSSNSIVAYDGDYRETEHLRVFRMLTSASEAQLQEYGIDSREGHEMATQIQKLLIGGGFPSGTEMLYVAGHKNSEAPVSKSVDGLQGIYHQKADQFNGRPCYQKVFLTKSAVNPLGCTGHCISWSRSRNLWKIGRLSEEKAGFAICRQDKPTPAEVDQAWCLYEAEAANVNSPGGEAAV
mmetsp:Transcript_120699/g.301145  ORF Transcript_120699/g.301145 Transcript_120699/m.301145 type:complete len:394 (-) Transcript_120699:33-1214(-)